MLLTGFQLNRLTRRVDRLEHSIGSIVNKIDAVLGKLENMETLKKQHQEEMRKIMDQIHEVISFFILCTLTAKVVGFKGKICQNVTVAHFLLQICVSCYKFVLDKIILNLILFLNIPYSVKMDATDDQKREQLENLAKLEQTERPKSTKSIVNLNLIYLFKNEETFIILFSLARST